MKRRSTILIIVMSLSSFFAVYASAYGPGDKLSKTTETMVYPNPCFDSFSIKNDLQVKSISIYNIVGKEVLTASHIHEGVHDVSALRKGIYLVQLLDEEAQVINVLRLTKK